MKSSGNGFSLIELLVVMIIVASLLGLVGPLVVRQVAKTQDHIELLELKRMLHTLSVSAFHEGREVFLIFSVNNLTISKAKHNSVISFEGLSFPEQQIVFNVNGMSETNALVVNYRSTQLSLNLNNENFN
jgi:prepilin-type N-terminal cleavage/methylation domain-containing protein